MHDQIQALEACIENAEHGLPEDIFLFATRITPMVNVDLLIQNESEQTLLTWRDDGYFSPGWHVPGGIIRYKETIESRLHAVAQIELGTDVDILSGPLAIHEVIQPTWKDRAHFISLLYACQLRTPPDPSRACSGMPFPGCWKWHDSPPADLIPVHHMYLTHMSTPQSRDRRIPSNTCPHDALAQRTP